MCRVGILALQGAFEKHASVMRAMGISYEFVRTRSDLERCSHLIIPGGESTVIRHHLKQNDLLAPLKNFAKKHPVFGTCAGLIVMVCDLELLELKIQRNGYGPQIYSFASPLESDILSDFTGIFIRAPRILEYGRDVEVLATCNHEPVLVRQGMHLACTFHPELTDNLQIHERFFQGERRDNSHLLF